LIAARMTAWRSSLGATASRVYPGLDAALWNRRRDRIARAARSRWDVSSPAQRVTTSERPVLVIITTGEGPASTEWRPAAGNHIFEVAQSAIDLLGADRVVVTYAKGGEPVDAWHERVMALLLETGATHVLANVETDPHDPDEWTWDLFVDHLQQVWAGTFIGLMYDSAFEWTTIKAKRLAKRDPSALLVALDRPLAGDLPGSRAHVGPVLLPLSRPTQAEVEVTIHDVIKDISVSFIGALYDYRVPILDGLRDAGVDVAVNPQRDDSVRTYLESRTAQPGYLAYMTALARSQITVNLSRAHAENVLQLKTRVLEASFAGCLVATDDHDRSDHYFTEGREFARFSGVEDAAVTIPTLLGDAHRLAEMQHAARTRAREIAGTVFWGAVDRGLRRSSLPPLLDKEIPE
jgi:hypothetical protein